MEAITGIMSLLFIKARLLNPTSRNVQNIPFPWESLYNHHTYLSISPNPLHNIPFELAFGLHFPNAISLGRL